VNRTAFDSALLDYLALTYSVARTRFMIISFDDAQEVLGMRDDNTARIQPIQQIQEINQRLRFGKLKSNAGSSSGSIPGSSHEHLLAVGFRVTLTINNDPPVPPTAAMLASEIIAHPPQGIIGYVYCSVLMACDGHNCERLC
jgi:hypothetical protein